MADDPIACSTHGSPRRGQRAQRSRGDGAGDRRRRRPPVGADGAAQGPRARRLRLLHQRSTAARAATSPPIRARPCCSTGSRCAARCGSRAPVERLPSDARPTPISPSRGRDSQLGAWASDQSRPLDSRELFEARFEEMKARFEGQDVPRPPHWGGYRARARADRILEDRPHRLHERRLFVRMRDGWDEGLLYP